MLFVQSYGRSVQNSEVFFFFFLDKYSMQGVEADTGQGDFSVSRSQCSAASRVLERGCLKF